MASPVSVAFHQSGDLELWIEKYSDPTSIESCGWLNKHVKVYTKDGTVISSSKLMTTKGEFTTNPERQKLLPHSSFFKKSIGEFLTSRYYDQKFVTLVLERFMQKVIWDLTCLNAPRIVDLAKRCFTDIKVMAEKHGLKELKELTETRIAILDKLPFRDIESVRYISAHNSEDEIHVILPA